MTDDAWILPDPDDETARPRPLPYRPMRHAAWDWIWLAVGLVALAVCMIGLVYAVA